MPILIHKNQTASFDVDVQKTFTPLCPDELPIAEGDMIGDELNRQAKFAKYRIGSKDAHSTKAIWVADEEHPALSEIKGDNVDVRWPVHAVPGTTGFELISELPNPKDYDYYVWKGVEPDMHPYGACFHDLKENLSTGVIEYLSNHHVDTVLVGGLALDVCVRTTAIQLANAGFRTILNLAASRSVSQDSERKALDDMKNTGVIIIQSTEDLELT